MSNKLKVQLLSETAKAPTKKWDADAGYDLYCSRKPYAEEVGGLDVYHTDLAVEIPEGYVGLLFPRSSVTKTVHRLANSVGVIDSNYRGEIILKYDISAIAVASASMGKKFSEAKPFKQIYDIGDRVGQLVIVPYSNLEVEVVEKLSDTTRGSGGFGSTGKN